MTRFRTSRCGTSPCPWQARRSTSRCTSTRRSGAETALGAYKLVVCLAPDDVPTGTPGRSPNGARLLDATFTVDNVFTVPAGPSIWDAITTPWAGAAPNPAGTVETRAFVANGTVTLAKSVNAKRRLVKFSGKVTQAGAGVAGTRVTMLLNGKATKFTARTNAAGAYSVVLKKTGKKSTSTFQARTVVAERDITYRGMCIADPRHTGWLRERNGLALHRGERAGSASASSSRTGAGDSRRGPELGRAPSRMLASVAEIRIGTCSWADDALSKHWYPQGVKAGERLAYYAEHFDTVEVDSTYYRLPGEEMVQRWAERTPDGFVMHVKAFGLMTRHPVKVGVATARSARRGADRRARAASSGRRGSFAARSSAGSLLRSSRLRAAGKLGGILFQFPSYVVYKDRSLDYLQWAREQLGDDELLVEFSHASWLDDEHRDDTLRFLEELGAANVIVDCAAHRRREEHRSRRSRR